jgi:hypothetical protein
VYCPAGEPAGQGSKRPSQRSGSAQATMAPPPTTASRRSNRSNSAQPGPYGVACGSAPTPVDG